MIVKDVSCDHVNSKKIDISIRNIADGGITPEDITKLVEHHFDVYRSNVSFEFLRKQYSWKLLGNPAGPAVVSVAENADGKIIGTYGGIPLRLKLCEDSKLFYLICCNSVSSQYLGTNLTKKLGQHLIEKCRSVSPTVFVGGFPNLKARAVQRRYFRCDTLLTIHTFNIPLNFYATLNRRVNSVLKKSILAALNPVFSKLFYSPRLPTTGAHSSLEISRVNELPDDYSSFWDKVRNTYENIFERDADFIRWRYFIPKHIPYEFYVVRNHGRLVGYFVIKVEDRTAVVVDFIAVSGMFQKMIEGIFDLIEHRKDIWNLKITIYHSDNMLEEMLDKVKSSLSQNYSLEILDISVTKGPAYQQVVKSCSWYLTDSIPSLG